jgi:predicted transcriptional regulator
MSNLSVKLDDTTRQRLKAVAAREGLTPHALMVQAIGGELERIEERQSFVERAQQAQARTEAGGPVYDGPAYAAHLRERVRASLRGEKPAIKKPRSTTLAALKQATKARA